MENQIVNNFVSLEEFLSHPLGGTVVPDSIDTEGPSEFEIMFG